MMRLRLIVLAIIVSGLAWSIYINAYGNGNPCTSAAFRDAFQEGRSSPDYSARSHKLLAFGSGAVPCLEAIATAPRSAANARMCGDNPLGCADWALAALGEINTREARRFLVKYLHQGKDTTLVSTAIIMLGRSKDEAVRPALQEMQKNSVPVLRAQAVKALAEFRNRADFDAMLQATLSLPDNLITIGVEGMLRLGDPRAVAALQKRAESIAEPTLKASVEQTIAELASRASGTRP